MQFANRFATKPISDVKGKGGGLHCVGPSTAASNWRDLGPLIVFFGLLTCVNAPFDWLSLGLTRFLLRRGLSKRNWWAPILYALIGSATSTGTVGVFIFEMLRAANPCC